MSIPTKNMLTISILGYIYLWHDRKSKMIPIDLKLKGGTLTGLGTMRFCVIAIASVRRLTLLGKVHIWCNNEIARQRLVACANTWGKLNPLRS